MKTIVINNKILKVYDSIDEMPIINFQKYNKYLLIDSGIGSNVDDIDAHIAKIAKFIKADDKTKALVELQNMRQNIYMINSQISPKYLAFAALIYSVDNRVSTDLSDDGLTRLLQSIREVRHSAILNFLANLKKKVNTELETYFPEDFTNAKEKEVYDLIKKRALLVLDTVENDTENSEAITTIDNLLFNRYRPNIFVGAESAEVTYDKQFESACILIAQKTNLQAKNMTVLEFYSALSNIKKQIEAELKNHKNKGYGRK